MILLISSSDIDKISTSLLLNSFNELGIEARHFVPSTTNLSQITLELNQHLHLKTCTSLVIYCGPNTRNENWISIAAQKASRGGTPINLIGQHPQFTIPEKIDKTKCNFFKDPDNLVSHFANTESKPSIGNGVDLQRNSLESQACLDIEIYADALGDILKNNSETYFDEFSFAIFGQWGQGKSYFAQLIRSKLPKRFSPVLFSAWKYPRQPEIWINLFKDFKTSFSNTGAITRIRDIIRFSLLRTSPVLFLFALFGLALTAAPFQLKLDAVNKVLDIVGIATLVFFAWFIFKIYILTISILSKGTAVYANGHDLGLQSILARDLKDLLIAHSPSENTFRQWQNRTTALPYYLLSFLISGLLVQRALSSDSFTPAWLLLVMAATFGYLSIRIPIWVLQKPEKEPRSFVLIVDDLDRLESKDLILAVESLNLLLDDEEIKKRLKIFMLVDQAILFKAIVEKYRSEVTYRGLRDDELIEEVLNKLFIGHITVPLIRSEADVLSLVKAFTSNQASQNIHSEEPFFKADKETQKSGPTDFDTSTPGDSDRKKIEKELYTDEETNQIISAILRAHGSRTKTKITPRSIKQTLLKYQLAREIIRAFKLEVPGNLADLVVGGYNPDTNKKAISIINSLNNNLQC